MNKLDVAERAAFSSEKHFKTNKNLLARALKNKRGFFFVPTVGNEKKRKKKNSKVFIYLSSRMQHERVIFSFTSGKISKPRCRTK